MDKLIEGRMFIGVPDPTGKTETAAFGLVGEEARGTIVRKCIVNGLNARWGAKLSHAFDLTFEDCLFTGGTERVLDIVRGGNIVFRRCRFERGVNRPTTHKCTSFARTCDIGIKGGARDITFEDCTMNDVLLGDYSIFNQIARPKTRRITLKHCLASNAWPIIVRELYAEPILTLDTPISRFHVPAVGTSLYFAFNSHFGDTRALTEEQRMLRADDLT